MTEAGPPAPGAPAEEGRQIGVDQWVAQADERREEHRGAWGSIVRLWRMLPPAGKLALLTPAIAVPFLPISSGNLFNYGIFILIYALLALGLNVAVGWAGLLDLSYVASVGTTTIDSRNAAISRGPSTVPAYMSAIRSTNADMRVIPTC